MLLSSLSICRLVRSIKPHYGVWVDKTSKAPELRNCTFRYFHAKDARAVADEMSGLIEEGGFDNTVKVTHNQRSGMYYVRINAVILSSK